MVLYFIAIAIAIYSLSDFKKGFIYYIAFQIFWYPNAELVNVRGLPVITLNFFMNFYFSALYLIYRKKFYKEMANPYAVPLFLTAISYFVTCFFAVAGFAAEIPRAVILILQDVVIINIAWNVLETKNDFKVLFKISTCIFLIAEIYGLMEYVLKKNFFCFTNLD